LNNKWTLGSTFNYSRKFHRSKERGLSGIASISYHFLKKKRLNCYGGLGIGYQSLLGKVSDYCFVAYFKEKMFKWLPFGGIHYKLGSGKLFFEYSAVTTISSSLNYYTFSLKLEDNPAVISACRSHSNPYFLYGILSLGYVFEF
jgi:hypothetical protein